MEKRLYIVRHCEAEGQDFLSPLTKRGFKQAESLSEFFSNIRVEQVISSPFLRAVQSVEPLCQKQNLKIEIDKRLSERIHSTDPLPDWLEKLKATFQDMELSYEGGESSNEATKRIVNVVEEALKNEHENILMATHGNLMSLLIKFFNQDFGFEQWQNLTNPDVFLLRFTNKQVHLERLWK
ncbi:histidine phosphatase family protein [Bacillus smithii]|uniref:histidine phosphatase family protein n=1 Tax=Bacillus smithii TaxID=1479 RepID=UPI003D1DAE73